MSLRRFFILLSVVAAGFLAGVMPAGGQPSVPSGDGGPGRFVGDTLSLQLSFPAGSAKILREYGGNGERIDAFREVLSASLKDEGVFTEGVFVHTGASPDGYTAQNISLSGKRAAAVREFLVMEFGLSPYIVHVTSDGESWDELAEVVRSLSEEEFPWKAEVLEVIGSPERYWVSGESFSDRRKARLLKLDDGKAWAYMKANVFPRLRGAYGDAYFVLSRIGKGKEGEGTGAAVAGAIAGAAGAAAVGVTDTVWVKQRPDTVTVEKIVYVEDKNAKTGAYARRVKDKRFIMASRTNILAVPFINVGVEIPFGEHFSMGIDYYYPWLQRNTLHKTCNELVAYGMDVRYWMGSSKAPKEARLLGHSFGVYGAGGHYDFEREWSGHQGTFFNIGVDWLYAFPLFKGRMHMELELGLGMIYSQAQPYDVFEPYGDGFRRPGEKKIVRWFGPTRAQVSLVVPIYVNTRNSRRR